MRTLRVRFTLSALFAVVVSVSYFAGVTQFAQVDDHTHAGASPSPSPETKPFFSLSTVRTYGSGDSARIWLDHRNISSLDFRVYRVKDPKAFFLKLANPHQIGKDESVDFARTYDETPWLLEAIEDWQDWIRNGVRNYVRSQLKRKSRATINEKLRKFEDEEAGRLPLNVSDYARVPLLNPDQLEKSWRQPLSQKERKYDRQMIALGKKDAGVYLIEAVNGDLRAYTVAIITDLAMIEKTDDNGNLFVYAADRKSGASRANVKVEVFNRKKSVGKGTTDNRGIFQTTIKRGDSSNDDSESGDHDGTNGYYNAADSFLVMADDNSNFSISDLNRYELFGYRDDEDEGRDLVGYIYTERPVYRPKQTVYFKGILRKQVENGYAQTKSRVANVTIEDPNGGKALERSLPLSKNGTFSGEVEIPESAPLGYYSVNAEVDGGSASGSFEVLEYKKPEYKVKVSAQEKFVQTGTQTTFTVDARYFFGSPVSNADVKYYIYRSRYYAWWWSEGDEENYMSADSGSEEEGDGDYYGYGSDIIKDGEAKLDKNGKFEIAFDVPEPDAKDRWDYTYRLEAEVTDSSRRTEKGVASFTGTRGTIKAHVYADNYVYKTGELAKINVRTSTYDGKPVSTSVKLAFVEQRWERIEDADEYDGNQPRGSQYVIRENEISSVEITTNEKGEAIYNYDPTHVGSITIKTTIIENGRTIIAEGETIWVTDKESTWPDYAYQKSDSIKLIPDKKTYRVGDTAHVLALLPTDKAHLLVTTELNKIVTVRQIDALSRATLIDVPIESRFQPNIYVSVSYVKDGEMYVGDKSLDVPSREKILKLEIVPNKNEYRPRETASYTVAARDADGKPVSGAEISLGVVDEAIYSIRSDNSGDMRRTFYDRNYNRVNTTFANSFTFYGYSGTKPIELAQTKRAFELTDFKNDGQYEEPKVRKLFKDTAFWQSNVITGADGKATVKFELPDNLTTWRATARAVTSDLRVGSTLMRVIERKDLILRLATPRFFTEGDTTTISAIVHNYLKTDKTSKISLAVTGATLLDQADQTVTIPKDGETRIDWRVSADKVGEVTLLAKALTDTESDAVELPFPVVPHGLRVVKGLTDDISGVDGEKTIQFDLPANVHPLARKIHIEVTPSIASSLFGGLDYLTSYPYGCTEQTMSSFLPTVIVSQTIKDVKTAHISSSNDIKRKVEAGRDRLYGFQHDDGGWGWWKDDESDPFMTAYVVDGLTLAKRAGYEIDASKIERARERLKLMIESGRLKNNQPIDVESRAFMIYALNQSGKMDAKYVDDLFANRNQLQPYGRALLALTLSQRNDKRAREIASEIESTASVSDISAHWSSKRILSHDFDERNEIEATSLSLRALSKISPQSSLLPKVARWLVSNRRHGYYWDSTKQTAFAILGLIDYVKVSKELSPDYDLEVYLNGEQILSRNVNSTANGAWQGEIIDRKGDEVPAVNQLRVVKRGKGIVYISAFAEYFTTDENTIAQSSPKLKIEREYLRLLVTENGEKSKWSIEPLSGELRSGDMIVSRLRVSGERGMYLMIEDPIPAGFEQLEEVSGINLNYTDNSWTDWYSAREFRDQKTVIFNTYFDGGATFQYAMRVITPGDFRVAPARAELMYDPTVQTNTSDTRIKILDK